MPWRIIPPVVGLMCVISPAAMSPPYASATPDRPKPAHAYAASWQDRYAMPGWRAMLTQLAPKDEARFWHWAHAHHVVITPDYDMRGFWRDTRGGHGTRSPIDGRIHYPDRYKTPLHRSFSGESRYARRDIPCPKWDSRDRLVSPSGMVLYDDRAANN